MKISSVQVLTQSRCGLFVSGALAVILGLFACLATAQSGIPPPFTPTILAEPANASQNTPRIITVQGQWPNSCPPTTGTLVTDFAESEHFITITLNVPQTFAPCTTVIGSYAIKFNYTPQSLGVIRVMVKDTPVSPSNTGTITTSLAGQNRAIADVSGMWYDAVTNGSGMSIIHNFQGVTSGLFGAWFAYDNAGSPRWLTIQEGKWETNGTFNGNLYETKAAPNQCHASAPLCVTKFSTIVKIGSAKLTFTGIGPNSGTPPQAIFEGFDPSGTTIMKSTSVRLPL